MSRKKKHGRWGGLLALLLLLAAGAAGWAWLDYQHFTTTPLAASPQASSVDVGRGSSFRDIVAQLSDEGVSTAQPLYWRVLAEQLHVTGRLHAGEYALTAGITPRDLLLNMAAGRVLQRNFTIVDGWSFRDLRAALASAPKLRHDSDGMDDATLMQKVGVTGSSPEGWFLPETYAYVKGDSDLDILRRAHAATVKMLGDLWPQRDKDSPLSSPYEALILASIVEKETGRADERPRIAGVFTRRLRAHMPLQTDPTVIYGMGDAYAGTIHKVDLTTDTPYNTYTRTGLPPTPIAMPGRPAMLAVLHPAPGTELYFVAKGDGTSVFSSTLEQHNRNVACYQLKRCQ